MNWCLGFLFLITASTTLFPQEKEEHLTYEDHPVLSWADFKGVPNKDSDYDASTDSGFSYSWSYSTSSGKQEFEYEVYSTFYPNGSWVFPNKKSDVLLAHEQLHFDISELHARSLRKAMANYEIGRNIRKDLKKIYADIEAQRASMQKTFDAESDHGNNAEGEAKWQSYFKKELKKLNDYSKS